MELYKIIFLCKSLEECLDWIQRHKFSRENIVVDNKKISFRQIEVLDSKNLKKDYYKFQEDIIFVFIRKLNPAALIEHQRKIANEILYLT